MKIAVCGGYDESESANLDSRNIRLFARHLSRQLIRQNHSLYCGNIGPFDALVIESACEEIVDEREARKRIFSYTPRGVDRFTNKGSVFHSQLAEWNVIGRKLIFPEPIEDSDIVILIGGGNGTHTAANWARLAQKPVLPVASFGMAACEIFEEIGTNSLGRYGNKIKIEEFDVLNRAVFELGEIEAEQYAAEIISLAERVVLPKDVFVVMAYREEDELVEARRAVQEVCEEFGFNGVRIDKRNYGGTYKITDEIMRGIEGCAFTIVDLTDDRPNIYYELGYAMGVGKPIVLTAKKGSVVHFDVQDLMRIEWRGFLDLRDQLRPAIAKLAQEFGLRNAN